MSEEKLLYVGIWLIIQASSFFFWLVLYFANPRSQFELKTQITRIRQLRWIAYVAGVAFGLFWLIDGLRSHYWIFGSCLVTASLGLEFPAGWLRKRMARTDAQESSLPWTALHMG
ncbi:MAG: hypothetical protein ABR956_16975 [Terracidiphilus sp.]|jgi:hypothetical protein